MCGVFEMTSENLKKQCLGLYVKWRCRWKWSSTPIIGLKCKNQDLHDLFIKTLAWINLCPAKN